MQNIDLRSDTVTLPSRAMYEAMQAAELGDDVYDEDPTVNRLQEKAAALLGKEAAIFVASGSMGNLVSLLAHCGRGDQVIAGEGSHIVNWEQGSASTLGGIFIRSVKNQSDGTLDPEQIEAAISPDNIHCARTKLICVENTWNGHPLSAEYMNRVRDVADRHHLKIHVDGARLFNAAVALKKSEAELVAAADSVQFCLSKGLAAPVGSMVCGSKDFIVEVKRWRKAVGGAMRQVGILAAAGIVALDVMRSRLIEDHQTATALAVGLTSLGCKVTPELPKTNMVFFDPPNGPAERKDFVAALKQADILVGIEPRLGIRAVTHYGITHSDIAELLLRIKKLPMLAEKTASVS